MNEQEDRKAPLADKRRYLIVGLGNPGAAHRHNRHNVGFMVIDRLAEKQKIELSRTQFRAIIGDGAVGGHPLFLIKPQTFMNLSGNSVGPLVRYYRIPLSNLLVVYDEIDLPFGALRLREAGGAGGHNGMKSLIQTFGQDFPRLRLGVGRPPGRMEPASYVLRDFGGKEKPEVDSMIERAVAAVETFVTEGIDLAMTRHNASSLDA